MERTVERVQFPVPAQEKLLRVAGYARVSCGKDAMMHSLSAQISYYSNLIQKHPGWLYCGVYADEARTGTNLDRPGFRKMMEECRKGSIDLIICKSITRMARNTVLFLETIRELNALGVDVFFEEQNINTGSAEGELMITILASYAQEESLSVSENVKWRIRKAFERGEDVTMRHLYGYTVRGGEMEIDPEQAEIVREIYRRAISGDSITAIAKDLNRRGVPSPMGGRWYHYPVTDILRNEKYTGNSLLMKHYVNNHIEKKKTQNNGERPMYYAEDTHPAIIDEETFEAGRAVTERNKAAAAGRKKPEHGPFTGLISCERCGANYRRCTNHDVIFWNCREYIRSGKAGCYGCRIRESTLYEITRAVAPFEDIEQITAGDNLLTYTLKDGSVVRCSWKLPSRSESWTPEMREQARRDALKKGR